MIEVAMCPLCLSEERRTFEVTQDSGFTLRYSICRYCAFVYQNPRMEAEALGNLYEGEYRVIVQGSEGPCAKDVRFQLARAYNQVRMLSDLLPKVARHLDVGCSSGALMAVMMQRYGCLSVGVEPGAAYTAFARSKGFRVFLDLDELAANEAEGFDLVSLSHVLEHLVDPVAELVALKERFIARNGHLLVEVPNLFGHRSLELAHLTAFTPTSLRDVLEKAGLRTVYARVHGGFRSDHLGMYITMIATPAESPRPYTVPRHQNWQVRVKRRLGMARLRWLSRIIPGVVWKNPSAAETEWPVVAAIRVLIAIAIGSWFGQWEGGVNALTKALL